MSVFWLTGLSGAGKTTIARHVAEAFASRGAARDVVVLDGDTLRAGLNSDLGFSREDRRENIRRIAEVAALFASHGLTVIVAAISPFAEDRAAARRVVGEGRFTEVFVSAPFELCEERDPKGLYARARAGGLQQFTGKDQAYEAPTAPELVLDTATRSAADCAAEVLAAIERRPR